VRVNAVAPGPIDTAMLDRFTGTAKNIAALKAAVPLGRIGNIGGTRLEHASRRLGWRGPARTGRVTATWRR